MAEPLNCLIFGPFKSLVDRLETLDTIWSQSRLTHIIPVWHSLNLSAAPQHLLCIKQEENCEHCVECWVLIVPELSQSFIAVFIIIWAHYLVMRHQKCKVHPQSLWLKIPFMLPKTALLFISSRSIPSLSAPCLETIENIQISSKESNMKWPENTNYLTSPISQNSNA